MDTILKAFKASLPALFGYVSLGMSFGFIAITSGLSLYQTLAMSTLVYAGAAQFVAISIFTNHGTLFTIASATFFVNLRHIFYGLSFVNRFPKKWLKKTYMIFGLTDEAYSILTATDEADVENFSLFVIAFAHFYWVAGALIGATLSYVLTVDLSFLKFTLTALFVVLAIEQAINIRTAKPFIIAAVASVVALLFTPHHMLVTAIGLCTATFIFSFIFDRESTHE